MSGILVIDKPEGYTSRDVVNIVGKELGTKKIGHTGTLDPLATGVLVLCIGKYTKLTNLLTSLDKEYIAEMKLGILTDTLDITGTVLKQEAFHVTKMQILKTFSHFLGNYHMEVPMYSAIKVNGRKLYKYARNGEKVSLPVKDVHIYELELLSFYQDMVRFRCKVEKGTYIRSLIRDLAKELGTVATMTHLVRTKQGKFRLEQAYSLEDIKNKNYQILKIKDVLDIPTYDLSDEEMKKVSNGAKTKINLESDLVLFLYHNEDVALYKREQELYKPEVMLI